ncbi:hypothetical protein RRG08_065020 [Elysia crispata]|uniref:Uncharacterized protein n=1 Tax=Elysia crispata TaxID=231223 RepID=A0AAE1D3T7_9GAST|nr:hypothetical protein RRG08_065020 [Elysia crispata]
MRVRSELYLLDFVSQHNGLALHDLMQIGALEVYLRSGPLGQRLLREALKMLPRTGIEDSESSSSMFPKTFESCHRLYLSFCRLQRFEF